MSQGLYIHHPHGQVQNTMEDVSFAGRLNVQEQLALALDPPVPQAETVPQAKTEPPVQVLLPRLLPRRLNNMDDDSMDDDRHSSSGPEELNIEEWFDYGGQFHHLPGG